MKERPILFKSEMVSAILDGRKTQTRRIVPDWQQPKLLDDGQFMAVGQRHRRWGFGCFGKTESECMRELSEHGASPYGHKRDRLWVRENGWERPARTPKMMREGADTWEPYYFDADGYTDIEHEQFKEWGFKRRPSIHMPRWASRIDLEITDVRVERLQDISEKDANAEGINCYPFRPDDGWPICNGYTHKPDDGKCTLHESSVAAYIYLWESINGPGSWNANHWIWVIEFRRIRP